MPPEAIPQMSAAEWDEIRSIARTWQFDRYLAATLAPRRHQRSLIVLAAFAGEIERILVTVSEPAIAAIRLQWWRDTLQEPGAGNTGNPLADAVREVIVYHNLPAGLVIGLIDTQEIEIYSDLVASLDELWLHFQKRDGALFDLSLRILGASDAGNRYEMLGSASRAYGLARSLAQLNWRVRARQLLLPADVAARHGIHPDLSDGVDTAAIGAAIEELSTVARAELNETRQLLRRAGIPVAAAFRPLCLCEIYLASAARQFDAAKDDEMGPSPISKLWRMLKAYCLGRV